MLKLRFFGAFSTRSFRRSDLVSCRVRVLAALLTSFLLSILAPCGLYAQSGAYSVVDDGTSVQTYRSTPNRSASNRSTLNRSAQRRETVDRQSPGRRVEGAAPSQTDVQSRGGVPAQIKNAATSTQESSIQNSGSLSGSEAAVVSKASKASDEAKNELEKEPSYLEQIDGKYAFLRLAKNREDFAKVRVAPNSQIVVVPRKNFLFSNKEAQEDAERAPEESKGSADNSALSARSELNGVDAAVSKDRSVEKENGSADDKAEDYVAFILTNLDSDEGVLLRDARDGRWDSTDLLSASLIAEGLTTPEKRAHYRSVYGRLLATLKPQAARIAEPFQKSEIVYNFLHQTALTAQYDLNSSSVAKALDSGVFNCVSATVLFNCFARECGLNVAALETTGHAKSRVKFDDSYLDIETTCAEWNRLPDRVRPYSRAQKTVDVAEGGVPAQLNSATIIRGAVDDATLKPVGSKTSDVDAIASQDGADNSARIVEEGSTSFGIDSEAPLGYSFTRTKRPMREITEVELVATIYYNVGVDYYQAGSYERAVASYVKALQLAPNNRTILGNLKATLNNWAIDLAAEKKRYDAAIQITLFGLALDPNFEEFNANLPIFFRDWVEYLAKDNKWEEIKRVQ